MQIYNSYYFNAYKFLHKLLPLLICCLLAACNGQNEAEQAINTVNQAQTAAPVVNINTASAAELEKLPTIGAKTAQKIIEHREKFGRFRRSENLLLVRGISDKKFREIKYLVKAD